jgi:hypothetical protein
MHSVAMAIRARMNHFSFLDLSQDTLGRGEYCKLEPVNQGDTKEK